MKSYLYILLIIAGISLTSCLESLGPPGPEQFVGTIFTNEGSDYLKDIPEDSLKIYFFMKERKTYCNKIHIYVHNDTTFFMAKYIEPGNEITHSISWLSAGQGITDFYIELGRDVDTLTIHINKKREYEKVLFNGKEAPTIKQDWEYLLQK